MTKTLRGRLQFHWDHGHFRDRRHPEGFNVQETDLNKLTYDDLVVRQAIASWQSIDERFDEATALYHGRPVYPDGEIGPGTEAMYELPRCACPDFGPDAGFQTEDGVKAAIGRGHWSNCHGANGYHKGVGRIIGSPASQLSAPYQGRRVVDAVMDLVRRGYGEIGLEWVWDWEKKYSGYQTEVRFGSWAGGWIGLAQVPSIGRSCSAAPLWAQLQNSFRSGSSASAVLAQWPILVMHELFHNCGSGHTRGGIMNPTIMTVPPRWIGDTSESLAKSMFGGVPVPGWPNFDGSGPDDPTTPANTVWNWQQPLAFADGTSREYAMRMEGPMIPGPGFGSFSGNFGKSGPPARMQCLFQPRMDEAQPGEPLRVAV
jgi:hypothetical protein